MQAIQWQNGLVTFIDQTKLPHTEEYITTSDYNVIIEAIKKLKIRGAPLIGIAAAYGVALACLELQRKKSQNYLVDLKIIIEEFKNTRPTAVNLFWALDRVAKFVSPLSDIDSVTNNIINEAIKIHTEDKLMCESIGKLGNQIVPEKANILTHCNTGALATGGEGTALAIIKYAQKAGKKINVFVDETRPLLQGARLTTWELMKAGINCTLITDNTAAFLLQQKKVDLILTGADRVTINGFAANKIGTYNLAVLAKFHNIPFYIAVPSSSIDLDIDKPEQIIIEERNPDEVRKIKDLYISPETVNVYNPSFDITPPELITGIITENNVYRYPYQPEFYKLKSSE